MNTDSARVFAGLSAKAKARRRRETLESLEVKRLALVEQMAGDEAEAEALGRLSYGQLVARKHGSPPTLPLTMDAVDRLNGPESTSPQVDVSRGTS